MPTPDGVYVEYIPANAADPGHVQPDTIVSPFSSKLAALEAAVDHGNRVAFVRFGQTIEQALADDNPTPDARAERARRSRSGKDELAAAKAVAEDA